MKKVGVVLIAVLAVAAAGAAHPYGGTGWGERFEEEIEHGDSHLAAKEYARALDAYERAEDLAPHAAAAPYRIALAAYRWGDAVASRRPELWALASRKAERAIFLEDSHAEAHFLLGLIKYRTGDLDGALEVYSSLEEMRQGDADLLLDLAITAVSLGDDDLALAALNRAREIEPDNPRLLDVARYLNMTMNPSAAEGGGIR